MGTSNNLTMNCEVNMSKPLHKGILKLNEDIIGFGMLIGFVIGLIASITYGNMIDKFWPAFILFLSCFLSVFIAKGIDLLVFNTLELAKSLRSMAKRHKANGLYRKLMSGRFDSDRIEHLHSDSLDVALVVREFFTDQLGRGLESCETVSVITEIDSGANQKKVLVRFTHSTRELTKSGSTKDKIQSIFVFLELKFHKHLSRIDTHCIHVDVGSPNFDPMILWDAVVGSDISDHGSGQQDGSHRFVDSEVVKLRELSSGQGNTGSGTVTSTQVH